jgi:NAD(P)-dependent dehydrogenase (short-subunit alcohol dehydrogenase family)
VALASRTGSKDKPEGTISLEVDVTKPAEVAAVFAKAEQELGAPVNVVVYNGQFPINQESLSLADLEASGRIFTSAGHKRAVLTPI